MSPVCPICEEPTDAALCHGCARRLALALRDVPTLARELDVTITKRAKVAHRAGPGPSVVELDPVKLEFDIRASEALAHLTGILRSWAGNLADDLGGDIGPTYSIGATALWLASHADLIRAKDWAPDLYAEAMDAIKAATRAIDAPPELVFKGHCPKPADDGHPCRAELWGKPGASEGRCRVCGAEVDYAVIAAAYMALAADLRAPASVIARALTAQGKPLEAMRIYQWVKRGHLAKVGKDHRTNQDLYRLGDVAEVLARMERKLTPGVIGKRKGGR